MELRVLSHVSPYQEARGSAPEGWRLCAGSPEMTSPVKAKTGALPKTTEAMLLFSFHFYRVLADNPPSGGSSTLRTMVSQFSWVLLKLTQSTTYHIHSCWWVGTAMRLLTRARCRPQGWGSCNLLYLMATLSDLPAMQAGLAPHCGAWNLMSYLS